MTSAKQAARIMLVPNRDILQRTIAEFLFGGADGAVQLAPPVFMFSIWVEDTAVRLRQLRCMEVPGSQDGLAALLSWTRARQDGRAGTGRALERSAARQARAADRAIRQWLGDGELPWLDENFYRQRGHVRHEMASKRLFTAEDWMEDLTRQLSAKDALPLALPEQMVFRGFVEFTALERRLLEALEHRGVALDLGDRTLEAGAVRVVEFPRPEDEWQGAAQWARDRLASGARSVCVVIPQRTTISGAGSRRIRQIFSAVFHPGEAAVLHDEGLRDFHIPAGTRLGHCGAIADAVRLLRLSASGMDREVEFSRISHWLLSPHWTGSDVEAAARARLEWRLRERGLFRLSPRGVLRLANAEGSKGDLPQLFARAGASPAVFEPGRAGTWLHAVLAGWGWPGPGGGLAVSRAVAGLQSLIERFDGQVLESSTEAVDLLEATCAEEVLPVGGGPLSPVQVLTPEVAIGGRFDALWACQFDDANWPPPIDINPCLPAAARVAIPRMNPKGQIDYYSRLTRMLCAAAPEVCLSWSSDAGEGPRMASGLIAELPTQTATPEPALYLSRLIWPTAGLAGKAGDGDAFETVVDSHGLAFQGDGAIELSGGADFLRLQAACPLTAYLRHRLQAHFPAMPSALASPQFRGELLHQVLRELYANAAGNRRLPEDAEIVPAVDAALTRLRARERLTATGLRAEAERLRRLMAEWLDVDRRRTPFEVAGVELSLEASLGRAALRVRIDRIDRLADGRYCLLDYKSGKPGRSRALKWGWSRIQEPQLPLYAVLLEAAGEREAGALAFAIVKSGDCGFDGIGDVPEFAASGIRVLGQGRSPVPFADWASFRAHWQSQLRALVNEILEGLAENRVHDPDALQFNDLALILRHDQAG